MRHRKERLVAVEFIRAPLESIQATLVGSLMCGTLFRSFSEPKGSIDRISGACLPERFLRIV